MFRLTSALAMIALSYVVNAQSPPIVPIQKPARLQPGEYRHLGFRGFVTSVAVDHLRINGIGNIGPNDEDAIVGEYRFELSTVLASGKSPNTGICIEDYRIGDVKVGDKIDITFDYIGKVCTCNTICILRRPGGRVPPSPTEPNDLDPKHHERMNARQDLEEKGIPLPFKFDSAAKIKAMQKFHEESRKNQPQLPPKPSTVRQAEPKSRP